MHKGLGKYVGTKVAIGSLGASDSWLLAPEFSSADERSRNMIDMEGHPDLSRSKVAREEGLEPDHATRSRVTVTIGRVTVTLGKVPVTPATGSETVW